MPPRLIPALVAVGLGVVIVLGLFLVVARLRVKVPAGFALLVHKMGRETQVSFTTAIVYPFLGHAELMDVSVRTLRVERRQANPLMTRDGVPLTLTATFLIRVNRRSEDVQKVAETVGVARVNDPKVIEGLFRPKLEGALEAVAGAMKAEHVLAERPMFVDEIIKMVGADLNGFHLDDVSIHEMYRTDG